MRQPDTPSAFLRHMDRFFDLLARTCVLLAGIAIVVMTAIFAWLVFGRYVLNDTPTWVEQVSLLLVMVIAFLGAAAGVHNHTHLSVVIFRNIVPGPVRTVFVVVWRLDGLVRHRADQVQMEHADPPYPMVRRLSIAAADRVWRAAVSFFHRSSDPPVPWAG